ncbi:MAG: S41 family peptidase [Lentisphaerae bacterium]|jgi:carboxyl-terminal processing protease|nr:S41 family peptidase [Lentisphaerota bacterium]
MKRHQLPLLIFAALLLGNLLLGFRVYSAEAKAQGAEDILENIDMMMEVLQLIRKNYVDADQVKANELLQGAIAGMVMSLDPYSNFLPPSEMKQLMEETEGEFGGVGISVSFKDEQLVVVATIDGTPAHKAGILAGDVIVAVDGRRLIGTRLDEAVKMLRGPNGSKVTVTIQRPDVEEEFSLELTRAMIPLESVAGVKVLPDSSIGYLRLTQFMEPTAAELEKALKELEAKNISGLILDLRDNPGGLLGSAVDVCSYFLPPGQVVVSVEGRDAGQNYQEKSRDGYKFPQKCPLVLLINGGSASAAEITAGCLRDLNRAILLGDRTFGKGSVQNIHQLSQGFALKLTIAKYFTPSRRVIHNQGIEPDIKVTMTPEQYLQLIKTPEQERYAIDPQLQRAAEVLKSFTVYENIRKGKVKAEAVQTPAATDDSGAQSAERK